MEAIEAQVLEGLRSLPTEKQQEILDFVEFLRNRNAPSTPISEGKPFIPSRQWPPGMTLLEAAGDAVGALDGGPIDLATNPKYMEGFGS